MYARASLGVWFSDDGKLLQIMRLAGMWYTDLLVPLLRVGTKHNALYCHRCPPLSAIVRGDKA